jgi:hypothetical protein
MLHWRSKKDAAVTSGRRWTRLLFAGALVALVAIDCLLWLVDEWLHPLPFAWLNLVALGITLFALSVLSAIALVNFALKRRFQFTIRSLLWLVVVVAVPLSWLATNQTRARHQARIVAEVAKLGGIVIDDLDYFSAMTSQRREPPEPRWIRTLFGEDFFREVTFVGFLGKSVDDLQFAEFSRLSGIDRIPGLNLVGTKITDEGAKHLRHWSGLRVLYLSQTAITDASLTNLVGLRRLSHLGLDETKVTENGVRKLHDAFPDCYISHKSKEEMDALRREADEAEKKWKNSASVPSPPQ